MMLQRFSAFLLKVSGWEIVGSYPHHLKKCIIIVGSHTSNWDFPVGILLRSATGSITSFIAKKPLFDSPIGFFFYWLGGIPVDQSGGQNFVEGVVNSFNEHEVMHTVISPEGTRKKVKNFRTGFFYMAKGANVPLVPTVFDWENKKLIFEKEIYPDEGKEVVINKLVEIFSSAKGYHPERGVSLDMKI